MSPNRPSCRPASASGGQRGIRRPPARDRSTTSTPCSRRSRPRSSTRSTRSRTARRSSRSSWTSVAGRRPASRTSEVMLLEREVTDADIAFVVEHIGTFGDDNRAGIERTLHRISAIRNRSGKIVGLTCRIGRAVYGTIEIINDFVETGKSILIMGRPGIGKTTMLREAARVLADDMGKRVVVVDTSNEIAGDGDIPHPAIGKARRMQVRTPVDAARGDDRGGREPHAAGHRHRRDRDGARGGGGPHDRRARRPADRHGARQQPRQPDAQPDPVRPDRRDPERDPRRRGGAPAADPEERPRAQGAADVRRHRRDPATASGSRSTATSPRPSTRCCAAIRSHRSCAGATRKVSIAPRAGRGRPRGSSSARSGSPDSSAPARHGGPSPAGAATAVVSSSGGYRDADRGGFRPGYRPGASGGWRQTRGGSGRESAPRGANAEGGAPGVMPGERFASRRSGRGATCRRPRSSRATSRIAARSSVARRPRPSRRARARRASSSARRRGATRRRGRCMRSRPTRAPGPVNADDLEDDEATTGCRSGSRRAPSRRGVLVPGGSPLPTLRVLPQGISRRRLEQAVRDLGCPSSSRATSTKPTW